MVSWQLTSVLMFDDVRTECCKQACLDVTSYCTSNCTVHVIMIMTLTLATLADPPEPPAQDGGLQR